MRRWYGEEFLCMFSKRQSSYVYEFFIGFGARFRLVEATFAWMGLDPWFDYRFASKLGSRCRWKCVDVNFLCFPNVYVLYFYGYWMYDVVSYILTLCRGLTWRWRWYPLRKSVRNTSSYQVIRQVGFRRREIVKRWFGDGYDYLFARLRSLRFFNLGYLFLNKIYCGQLFVFFLSMYLCDRVLVGLPRWLRIVYYLFFYNLQLVSGSSDSSRLVVFYFECLPLSKLPANYVCALVASTLVGIRVVSEIGRMLVNWYGYLSGRRRSFFEPVTIGGFCVRVAGKIGRDQRATYDVFRGGQVPFNCFDKFVSYAQRQVVLRYGVVGVRVWLWLKKDLRDG